MGNRSIEKTRADPTTAYTDDVYTWVQEQVALLRSGRLSEVDALNVAEELSDSGQEIRDKLESAIAVLTLHLLKWDHQPSHRSRSWALSVREQRRRIERLLKRNPGLKALLAESVREGYADGRDRALDETGLDDAALPTECPYDLAELMTRSVEFAPAAANARKR